MSSGPGTRPTTNEWGGWFADARFGLFIHWGPYSASSLEPSWPLVGGTTVLPQCQSMSVVEYYERASTWAPPRGAPARWLELASACGMEYAVLTTKHHDGFTLFPTAHSELGIHTTAPGRDLVGEYVEAVRSAGLRLGFYFSLPDWHHPSYPAFTDEMRPYPMLGYPRPSPEAWDRFRSDQIAQLDHLLTEYGTVDLLWFDGGWERTADEWHAAELEQFVRERQPDIVVNDRLPGVTSGYSSMLHEQTIPFDPPSVPFETCLTMDESWGPLDIDAGRKSAHELLGIVADSAAAGGKVLLNVAPDGNGGLLPWQRDRLEAIASWMACHREAILGTGPGLGAGHFYGPTTRRDDRVYLICPMRPVSNVTVRAVHGTRITAVRALGTGAALDFELRISAIDRIFGGEPVCDVVIHVPVEACDEQVTVLEVTGAITPG